MTITEEIIRAIREKEKKINNQLHQKIEIRVQDGKVLIVKQEVLWKIK